MKKAILLSGAIFLNLFAYPQFGKFLKKQKQKLLKGETVEEVKEETKKLTLDEKILDIEIFSDAARTKKITILAVEKNSKIYCRANLSAYLESLGYYMSGKEYKIFMCAEHLKKTEGRKAGDNDINLYEKKEKLADYESIMAYQADNKYLDFEVDFGDERAADNFQRKLRYNKLSEQTVQATVSINCDMDYAQIASIGYLTLDFSKLLNEQNAKQEAKRQEDMKVVFPTPAFTDNSLKNKVLQSLQSASDVVKVYKIIFTEPKEINRNANGSVKNRWCRANAWVKLDNGKCYKLVLRIYEDMVSGHYQFDGNAKTETSREVLCNQLK